MFNEISVTMNWTDALIACNNSTFAGHSDWRLPNYNEIQSIFIITDLYLDLPFLYRVPTPRSFWSSTTDVNLPEYALGSFGTGVRALKSETHGAWCVRGGQ